MPTVVEVIKQVRGLRRKLLKITQMSSDATFDQGKLWDCEQRYNVFGFLRLKYNSAYRI